MSFSVKRNYLGSRRKTVARYFSLRDTWDVLVIALLLGIVVYFAHYADNNPDIFAWPRIEHVKVSGKLQETNREAFKNIIRERVSGGFFYVPMYDLEQQLEKLPWIRRAMARRIWPNTLSVTVYEEIPVARWGNTGLMNAYGELFFPPSVESYTSLPTLFGEQVRTKDLANIFKNSMKRLQSTGLQPRGLFEDQRQSKHMVLSNGMIVAMGDGDIDEKITRLIIAYEQYLSPRLAEVKGIDLRYTSGLAIEWKSSQPANNLALLEGNL